MTIHVFDSKKLEQRLRHLKHKHQLVFAASCCNRTLPSYGAFSREANWGNFEVIQNAVEYVWNHLEGEAMSIDNLDEYLEQIQENIPDLDEVTNELATWGHDSALVAFHMLCNARNHAIEDVVACGTWSYDSVDTFVQMKEHMDPSDPELEIMIASHPVVQRELAQQHYVLEALEKQSELTVAAAMSIRYSWNNAGRSNIDIM